MSRCGSSSPTMSARTPRANYWRRPTRCARTPTPPAATSRSSWCSSSRRREGLATARSWLRAVASILAPRGSGEFGDAEMGDGEFELADVEDFGAGFLGGGRAHRGGGFAVAVHRLLAVVRDRRDPTTGGAVDQQAGTAEAG